ECAFELQLRDTRVTRVLHFEHDRGEQREAEHRCDRLQRGHPPARRSFGGFGAGASFHRHGGGVHSEVSRIAQHRSSNEMPRAFAAIGTSECDVMPGTVLISSRYGCSLASSTRKSTRPQPAALTSSKAFSAISPSFCSNAADTPDGQ